ncbi:hypothetical protein PsorP6_013324 [Peronosclerospora sorghi]|uniref:Uncharacterized protein n=1 Tax=Peronosclerospora sorghi TaxID=230839 RepID=A0ACC0WHS7_9STRA|nr:hypothetical protein PsorP6_013324 [Peronosclerospora sorghi]
MLGEICSVLRLLSHIILWDVLIFFDFPSFPQIEWIEHMHAVVSSTNGYVSSSSSSSNITSNYRPIIFHPHVLPSAYDRAMESAPKYESGLPCYSSPPPQPFHLSPTDNQSTATATRSGSSTPSHATKRSREDLNQKEKQRMFKLNDRINQLKRLLDDAGVQTKKNKQSILDNTSHYIELLRKDLVIAQQKAERAEKQTETIRQTFKGGTTGTDKVTSGVFQKTTTPRVVLDMDMKPVVFNNAFVKFTGLSELVLKKKKTLRPYLCADETKFEYIMKQVYETKHSIIVCVQTIVADVNLVAAAVTDDKRNDTNVDFSLIPIETHQRPLSTKRAKPSAPYNEIDASDTKSLKRKEKSSPHVEI